MRSSNIKIYLDEHKVSNTMADDYALTHKLNCVKNKSSGGVPNLN